MSTGGFKKPLDPRKLASQGAVITGTLGGDLLLRFNDAVVDSYEPISCKLEFEKGADGHAVIHGELQGDVKLPCERCLEPVGHNINTNFDVRPVLTDAQAEVHQKSIDVVMLDSEGQIDPVAMIEDELLLGLPIVIYHDYECVPVMQFGEDIVVEQDAQKDNPFAMLANLNRQEDRSD